MVRVYIIRISVVKPKFISMAPSCPIRPRVTNAYNRAMEMVIKLPAALENLFWISYAERVEPRVWAIEKSKTLLNCHFLSGMNSHFK